jgi:Na+/H+-dicarboxylate symporter
MHLPDWWDKPIEPLVNPKRAIGTLLAVVFFAFALGCAANSIFQQRPAQPISIVRAQR